MVTVDPTIAPSTIQSTELTSDSTFDVKEFLDAARYGELEEIQEIVATFNTDTDRILAKQGYNGNTALHMACANGHVEVVKYLLPLLTLEEINVQNNEGNTALHWASLNGHKDVAEQMVMAGAKATLKNNSGKDAIYEAGTRGFEDLLVILLKAVDVDEIELDEGATDEVVEDDAAR